MATFSVEGYEIFSHSDRQVSDIKPAQLQIVSTLGSATMDFSYATEDPGSAEVSLSDYNILLNGLHLNDGTLPERIELFNLSWNSGTETDESQVMNFAFQDGEGWRDCLFSVGQSSLPDLSQPGEVNNLLETARFSVLDKDKMSDGFRLHLDDMPGVSIDGVILKLFEDEAAQAEHPDQFHFFQPPEGEAPDVTEFDVVARARDQDALNTGQPAEEDVSDLDLWDAQAEALPGAEDFIG